MLARWRRASGNPALVHHAPRADSPDLTPIEPAWSTRNTLLRGVGAPTPDARHAALTTLVDAITPHDAQSDGRQCGYARSTQS